MAVEAAEPLYQRIKRDLVDAIRRGEYDAAEPFVTERQLCERFEVSSTTAVKALNDLVVEGVLVRHRGKGTYVADRPGTLREGRPDSRVISVIVPGLNGPHVSQLVRGVESVCADLGWLMVLSDPNDAPDRERRALQQALDQRVHGVVLYSAQGDHNADVLGQLREQGIPVVLADRYRTDLSLDSVTVDNFAIGYQLTQHLVALGHTEIATLWSETSCSSVLDRLAGHVRALHDTGLEVRPDFMVLRKYQADDREVRQEKLSQLIRRPVPPTVLLCSQGFVMSLALTDLLDLGLSVPDQMDLASMDHAGPYDVHPIAAVTAVLPSFDLGVRAMELLRERVEAVGAYEPRRVVLDAQIVSRRAKLRLSSTVIQPPETAAAVSVVGMPSR